MQWKSINENQFTFIKEEKNKKGRGKKRGARSFHASTCFLLILSTEMEVKYHIKEWWDSLNENLDLFFSWGLRALFFSVLFCFVFRRSVSQIKRKKKKKKKKKMLINFINSMILTAQCLLHVSQPCVLSSSYQLLCLRQAATNRLPGLRVFFWWQTYSPGCWFSYCCWSEKETKIEMLVVAWI